MAQKATAQKANNEEHDPEAVIESAIGRTEAFIMKNGKVLLTVLGVIVLLVGVFFAYKYLIQAPREDKAAAAMFIAQQQLADNAYEVALKGDGNFEGFEAIASQYGSTPSGNLARHYSGICYMRMGQYEEALKMFESYKEVKGVPGAVVNARNCGLQGDAYSQLANYTDAAAMYEKAVAASDNTLTAPEYLKKLGIVYEKLGDNAKALQAYKRISDDYGNSLEARDVEKFIGRLEQL